MEGVYLEENHPTRGYEVVNTTSTSMEFIIPNRDVRPMKDQRINFTFYYYKEDNEEEKIIELDKKVFRDVEVNKSA